MGKDEDRQSESVVDRDTPTSPAVPRPRPPRTPIEALATGEWQLALAEITRRLEDTATRVEIVERHPSLQPPPLVMPSSSLVPPPSASLTPVPESRPSVAARAATSTKIWTDRAMRGLGLLLVVTQLLSYWLSRRDEVGPLPAALEILLLAFRGGQ